MLGSHLTRAMKIFTITALLFFFGQINVNIFNPYKVKPMISPYFTNQLTGFYIMALLALNEKAETC